jgi:hypothetical protein
MSFNRIFVLLPDAFARIDKSHELTKRRSNETIATALQAVLVGYNGQYHVEYSNGTLLIYTASVVLKHYIHQNQEDILSRLRESISHSNIEKITFKGPRQ